MALLVGTIPSAKARILLNSDLLYNHMKPISTVLEEIENDTVVEALYLSYFLRTITTRTFFMATCFDCHCIALCHDLSQHKVWAPVEATIFERILNQTREEDRKVVDVGANIGYFTILSAAWGAMGTRARLPVEFCRQDQARDQKTINKRILLKVACFFVCGMKLDRLATFASMFGVE